MAINESHRILEVARDLEHQARTLAHSSRTVPNPSDSYTILGELHSTASALAQSCRQIGRWITLTNERVHHEGYDPGEGNALLNCTLELQNAAVAFSSASELMMKAQVENGRIRWIGWDET